MRPILNIRHRGGVLWHTLEVWLGRSDNQEIREPYQTIPCDIVKVHGDAASITQLNYLLNAIQVQQESSVILTKEKAPWTK